MPSITHVTIECNYRVQNEYLEGGEEEKKLVIRQTAYIPTDTSNPLLHDINKTLQNVRSKLFEIGWLSKNISSTNVIHIIEHCVSSSHIPF